MKKDKLAIFDLDGTLFDTGKINYLSYRAALEELGYTVEYDYFCNECNGRHYKEFLPRIGIQSEIDLEYIHVRKKELYATNLSVARLNKHLFNMIDLMKDEYYLAIVTTASSKNCKDILRHFNKYEIFDLILTYEDVKKVKPSPEGFLKAMKNFNMDKDNTIIFEDSDVGIQAARATGASILKVDGIN